MDVFELVAGAQRGYLRDAVLHAAHDLRLFDAPAAAPTRRMRKLLDAVALFGLTGGEPDPAVRRGGWGSLAEVIRSDRPLPEDRDSLERFHAHLLEAGAEPARELWQVLPVEGPLLDLGGGAGSYTAAYLAAFPGQQATIADRPEVLRLARAPGARLLDVDLLNMSTPPVPAGQGAVLLANVLHLFGSAQNVQFVQFANSVLHPGGTLVIKDLRSDTDEGVLFALNLALFTEEGDVHPPELLEKWVREAGFANLRLGPLRTSQKSLVLAATKP